MSTLAIKSHATRGKEVIQLLEMLGGKNVYNLNGNENVAYYVIENSEIRFGEYLFGNEPYIFFTLEEFEEKYPYKVGDKVSIPEYESEVYITKMEWNGFEIMYCVNTCYGDEWFTSQDLKDFNEEDLQPYKEQENMEENKDLKQYGTATIKYIQEKGSRDMELIIPYNQEIVIENGRYILRNKKPQYPKTYKECCGILNHHMHNDLVCGRNGYLLSNLQNLLTIRDAYWKIAGDWEPDWCDENKLKYCIECSFGTIDKTRSIVNSCFLAFPTEEMRDEFYENFKSLIEECKELL